MENRLPGGYQGVVSVKEQEGGYINLYMYQDP